MIKTNMRFKYSINNNFYHLKSFDTKTKLFLKCKFMNLYSIKLSIQLWINRMSDTYIEIFRWLWEVGEIIAPQS